MISFICRNTSSCGLEIIYMDRSALESDSLLRGTNYKMPPFRSIKEDYFHNVHQNHHHFVIWLGRRRSGGLCSGQRWKTQTRASPWWPSSLSGRHSPSQTFSDILPLRQTGKGGDRGVGGTTTEEDIVDQALDRFKVTSTFIRCLIC